MVSVALEHSQNPLKSLLCSCSIFTSMLGVKANVPKIMEYLKQREIGDISSTEFHQGHTTRWAIAWSYSKQMAANEGNP